MNARSLRWLVNLVGALGAIGVQIMLWAANYAFAQRHLVGDETRYLHEALRVWQGQPSPPDYIWPPLQQWFLAPLVGPLDSKLWLAQLVQTVFLVLAAWALRQLWRRMDPRPLAGDIAFWLLLTSPAVMALGFYLWPEPLHLLLMLGALWLVVCHGRSLLACVLAGAAIGLALLAKSLLSGFWPLFLLPLLRWPLQRVRWRNVAALLVAFVVVAGPFMWQGFQTTGKPLISDSSVFNLYSGLNDQWRSDYVHPTVGRYMQEYRAAGDGPRQRNAVFGDRIDETVATHGGWLSLLVERSQVQYFRLFNAKRTVVSMLPGARCKGYIGAYVVPTHWVAAIQVLTRAHFLLVLVLAAFGAVLWRRPKMLLLWIALFFAYQLLLFLGLHIKARYLVPMLPFLCGFAASAMVSLMSAPATADGLDSPLSARRWRLVPAVALALLLLFLACAGPWLDSSCSVVP